ncbi:Son of sevenless 1 [Sarracenia purpurea var. burkii]
MAMQDLRALVAERSEMTTYLRGENIEIPPHSIGFLLEGFVKMQGVQEELITSPAALLPSYGDLSILGPETSGAKQHQASFSHQLTWYHVETRARVILFDMAAFESNKVLQRRTSSMVPRTVEHPTRTLSKVHSGLMSWPENTRKASQHRLTHDGTVQQEAHNLSAMAMQLSIFGSMVDEADCHSKRFPTNSQARPSHSLSYPRVPSCHGRTLVSVRSEGSSHQARKNLEVQDLKGQDLTSKPPTSSTKKSHVINDSSDESDTEDELIVRIDSPSRLSFRQA